MSLEFNKAVAELESFAKRIINGATTNRGERDEFDRHLHIFMLKTVPTDPDGLTVGEIYRKNAKQQKEASENGAMGRHGALQALNDTVASTGVPRRLIQMWINAEKHRERASKTTRR